MFISPYLNRLIDTIEKKDIKNIAFIVIVLISIYSFFFDKGIYFNGGYSLIWGIVLYIVGGVINKFKYELKSGLFIYIIASIMNAILVIILFKTNHNMAAWSCFKYTSLLVFTSSLSLLLWFNSLKKEIKSKKLIGFITTVATSTLMIYIIHTGGWIGIFRGVPIKYLINNNLFILLIVILPIYAFLILMLGTLVSILYKKSIGKLVDGILNKCCK